MRADPMENAPAETAERLERLALALRPDATRARVLGELDRMFRRGVPPDPSPDGFLPGRLITTSVWGPLDGLGRRLAARWMPWQGKAFDRDARTGLNRFTPDARLPMRLLWPSYQPLHVSAGRMEAFPFRTSVGPGAVDPGLGVLKIDYDFEANPSFIIRRILDELVELEPGTYLGKVLFRLGRRFHPIGFFSLHQPR